MIMRGRRFSYLDEGEGVPVLALHGTFGRAEIHRPLADILGPGYRLLALDQRGHGLSSHGGDFSKDAFVQDAATFLQSYGPAIVFGHSLGGVHAYQLAARHPDLVRGLIVEDIGAVTERPEVAQPTVDIGSWPRITRTRDEFVEFFSVLPDPGYFLASLVQTAEGWRMLYDYDDMMAVQQANVGRWWDDWLGSSCPALLLRGSESFMLSAAQAQDMLKRPNTQLVEFPGAGHWLHTDDPERFARVIREFVASTNFDL
ncbi:alpha/beta hydrolase [Kibdelosporangium philippinense]|uniref:Alpha/beta hydrolase n=1 Tax=Kibdelosporangium philippinense TaxID=211113 RepID=A0ABS8ZIB0_9PSEU|nr:alpha/beta hydrolase [Kibdelosporangium philippinense]MCE7007553.1 alpha/beta hydrolase [Kibdelosporangium philippinense]